MSSIPLPALQSQAPQQPGVLDQYSKVLTLRSLLQGQQTQQLQNQQLQMQVQDQQKMRSIMSDPSIDWNKPDALGQMLNKGAQAGVSPQMLQQIRNGNLEYQQKLAAMNKDQQDIHIKNLDQTRGELTSLINDPNYGNPASQQTYQRIVQRHIQAGDIQQGQFPDQLPPKEILQPMSNGLALGSVLAKEASEQTTANARQQQAQTSASLAPSEISRNTAQATLATTQNAQAGQVTPKDQYVQNQENYRATLQRAATNANELQKQGISNLQKQSDTYTQFLGTAQSLKNSLQAAQNGNQMAAAVAPLQGTLFITTSEGVKRINETELRGVSGAGSLVQRINGALGQQSGKGPLSDQLKQDMSKLVDLYTASKYNAYQKQAAYTQKLHGLDPATTPILDQNGNIAGQGQSNGANDPLGIR